jgi:CheY-like chemotaxis protein
MVYGAVRQNKGSIEVYSVEGQGTSFKMYFPVTGCESVNEQGVCEDETPVRGHETVMIVEDSPLVLDFSVSLLVESGYRVMEAESGEEAIRSVNSCKEKIDLLITDVVLPGINGKVLAEEIKKARPDIKVLYTSGYTENFIVQQDLAQDGVSFINKPYSAHSFLKKIRDILDAV